MKRAHVLLVLLVFLAAVGYRPVLSLLRGGSEAEAISCEYEGRTYVRDAQRRADDGCNVCTCGENGWACTKIACVEDGPGVGSISGTLSYPSEYLPAQLVCAIDLKNGEEYCQQTTAGETDYDIPAPAGEYWVYASLVDDATGKKAYYSEFVLCGLKAECKDHTPVTVAVESGKLAAADPQDWYAAGQIDLINVSPSRYEYATHHYYPGSVFRLEARGLSRVEFQSTPYPPDPEHRDDAPFTAVGAATLVSEERGKQVWTLAIPEGFQAMEVRARGESGNGDFLLSRELRIVRPIATATANSNVK